jgi:hypothetical protein
MSNNNQTYISQDTPISDMDRPNLFSRQWFRFLDVVAKKLRMLDGTTTDTATAGTATLPAQPAGFMIINDNNGVARKVPYYNA